MHILSLPSAPSAPGKDEVSFLQSVIVGRHGYRPSIYYVHNAIAYHNENQSVNFCSQEAKLARFRFLLGNPIPCVPLHLDKGKGVGLVSILAHRDSGAGGFGDELPLLIGHRHLGNPSSLATPHHTALGGELIIYPGASNEMDVEL